MRGHHSSIFICLRRQHLVILTADQAPPSLVADLLARFHALIPTRHHPVDSVYTAGNSCDEMQVGEEEAGAHFSVMSHLSRRRKQPPCERPGGATKRRERRVQ